jgi:hypothetical protein
VAYYPDWKTRIVRKNEHRLDVENKKIATRERWVVQCYYGGEPREMWDEVVAAEWDGEELDDAKESEESWIETILGIIQEAQKPERRSSYALFLDCIADLAKCIEESEDEVWSVVDFQGASVREEERGRGIVPEWRVERERGPSENRCLWTYCHVMNELLDKDDVRRLWWRRITGMR